MALVLNADLEQVKVQAFGNWFTFAPGQIKHMEDKLAHFLVEKRDMGFAFLPENYYDDVESEASKTAKAEAEKIGRAKVINHLKTIIYNLEVSLQKDLDIAGMKVSAKTLASQGEINAYKKLAKYSETHKSQAQDKEAEINELKKVIDGGTL